jgi:hypothetical protein
MAVVVYWTYFTISGMVFAFMQTQTNKKDISGMP